MADIIPSASIEPPPSETAALTDTVKLTPGADGTPDLVASRERCIAGITQDLSCLRNSISAPDPAHTRVAESTPNLAKTRGGGLFAAA